MGHALAPIESEELYEPMSILDCSFASSRSSLATPRQTLVAVEAEDFDEVSMELAVVGAEDVLDARDSISSVRATLPNFREHVAVSSAPMAPSLPTFLLP